MEGSKEQIELLMMYEEIKKERDQYMRERDELIKDVEKLRELKDQLIFENRYLEEQVKSLRNKYTNLTEHIRFKALHNPSVSRYKDLMHFIDELEGNCDIQNIIDDMNRSE